MPCLRDQPRLARSERSVVSFDGRGLNQHGIEDRPIDPPARLLGVEYELVGS
jgi:hypothetical protein